MLRFAIAYGYVVTADFNGDITLNARVVVPLDREGITPELNMLLQQANAMPDLLEALEGLQSALDEYNKPGLQSDHAMVLLAARDTAQRAIDKAKGN